MRVSVILSTYQQAMALELVLEGYARQTAGDFEVVVADDGSDGESSAVLTGARARGLKIRHVWHSDRGFRKTEALNRAILASEGDYLIFSDGDCVPREDFVATHLTLAKPECFLSGGYLKLPENTSQAVDREVVRNGRLFDAVWLKAHGYRPGRRRFRLLRSRNAAAFLDALTPTGATWNGHNASTWKHHLHEVNGFDLDMGWGGLDRALGERLENLGICGKQVRHRAVCVHLHHERPYRSAGVLRANKAIRERIRTDRKTRTPNGLAETGAIEAEVHIDPPLGAHWEGTWRP